MSHHQDVETETQEQILHNLVAFAASERERGHSSGAVRMNLVRQGIPDDLAREIVAAANSHVRLERGDSGVKTLLAGLGWLALGGLITAYTYSAASPGGSYVVTTGLFAVRGIQAVVGLLRMMRR